VVGTGASLFRAACGPLVSGACEGGRSRQAMCRPRRRDNYPDSSMSNRLPYAWLERETMTSGKDLLAGALYGVNQATEALARTMEPLSTPSVTKGSEPPKYWIQSAVLHMAAIGMRSGRAAAILVQGGYAPEGLAQLRVLHESVDHIRWVLANPQGDNARNWLTDERSRTTTARKIARQSGSQVTFDLLSTRLHVTPNAAQAFRLDLDSNDRFPITVVPAHDARESESILFAVQGKLLEICELLAEAWDIANEDPELDNIRMARRIDGARHETIETLLAVKLNPFRDSASAVGSYI
jgi:hypothetical protein